MGFPGAASPHLELEDPCFPGMGGPLGLSLGRQVFEPRDSHLQTG